MTASSVAWMLPFSISCNTWRREAPEFIQALNLQSLFEAGNGSKGRDAIRAMWVRMRETHGGLSLLIDGLLYELPKPPPAPPPPPSPLAGYAPERIARARKKLKAILSDEANQRKIVEYAMEAQAKRLHPEPFRLKPRKQPSARPHVASIGRFLCERHVAPFVNVDEGLTVVPPHVRMSLHRIRRSTGLPIDLDLL